MIRHAIILAVLVAGSAAPLAGQSLLGTRGLGVPVVPVDARGRALGGIGVGLLGTSAAFLNPADAAGAPRKGVLAVVQPTTGTVELNGVSDDFGGARFPVVNVLYPIGSRLVATAGYGGFLDQSWAITTAGQVELDGETVETRDFLESRGGISRLQLGLAYTLTPRLAVALGGGVYTGGLERRVARGFPNADPPLQAFDERFRWDYLAPHVTIGVRWDPDPALRLSAAYTVSGDLEADSASGPARSATFELPHRAVLGASGMLGPDLMAALGAERTFGAVAAPDVAVEPAAGVPTERDTWRLGGGLEYTGVRRGTRNYPLRLGGSWMQLPYHRQAEDPAREWAVAGGAGFHFGSDPSAPLALADLTLERGSRSGLATMNANGLSESFWRFTFAVAVFGQ
jgi:hypothetical protein